MAQSCRPSFEQFKHASIFRLWSKRPDRMNAKSSLKTLGYEICLYVILLNFYDKITRTSTVSMVEQYSRY